MGLLTVCYPKTADKIVISFHKKLLNVMSSCLGKDDRKKSLKLYFISLEILECQWRESGKQRDEGACSKNGLSNPNTKILEIKRAAYNSLECLIPSLLC